MKLSIITINKNNAEGLKKTVSSVFNQLNHDFEYIIIDGASTDGSLGIIKEFQRAKDRPVSFKWVSEMDGGIFHAMNKGISLSSGEYLLFLNSGDSISDNNVIEEIKDVVFSADIVIAKCNMKKNNRIVWTYIPKENYSFGTLFFYGIAHQAAFIKRSLFIQYGLYDESFKYNGDIEFWYRAIIDHKASTQALDSVVTDYELGGVSDLLKDNPLFLEEHKRILSNPAYEKYVGDYELWRSERNRLNAIKVVEQYPLVLRILNRLNRLKRSTQSFFSGGR